MSRSLSAAGYACQLCRNRDRLIDMVDSQLPDILLLRLDEKEEGIFSLISQVKEKGVKRILLLVKAGQEALVNGGLFAGGDDYLCLPVRQYELQTRISVLARQIMPDVKQHYYLKYGHYEFARYPNDLIVSGKSIRLTAKEFDLALLFFRHIGMPLSRAHIAEAIWDMDGNEMIRTIDTHVSRVRNKLNLKPKNGFLLEQVYGFGYQLLSLAEK
ncbi:response regulator transcription factor [Oxalobacter vibrioformis]|uniref:Response regulator transcription factor n=1 Tax=Oxalobacter vibrioformis TaxID=933080 RepID=A0A9E9M0C7_9BURK|nr:response regulator transcription factor [Oxalobacter vibrioformis]WAW10193.1 response regulator transcription factor [Oxalobacter vibrioformis]